MVVMIGDGGGVLMVGDKVATDPACCCGEPVVACNPATVPVCSWNWEIFLNGNYDSNSFTTFTSGPGSCVGQGNYAGNVDPVCGIGSSQVTWTYTGSGWLLTWMGINEADCMYDSIYTLLLPGKCPTIGSYSLKYKSGPNIGTVTVTVSA
jgi:hypothetical protein